ncbi:MAG: hypothetical protein HZC36_13065 [Armatimonadetes bacterium]|nr:hypothetical protein [Armatimonadota bacterium]
MNYRLAILATLAVGAILAAPATVSAQKRSKATAKKVVKKAPAKAAAARDENGLVGVHLFDPATVVLNKFGSPNEIEAVGISSGSVGPVGPSGGQGIGGPASPQGAGPGVPPGMGIPGAGGGGGGGSAGAIGVTSPSNDFGFGSTLFMQDGPGKGIPRPSASGPGGTIQGGPPGPGASGGGPGRAIGGGSGSSTSTNFTRWIYNRPNSKYAFIVNKQGRVVQIEAIGIKDAAVRTNRGTSFGAPFASLVKAYGNPDGYDIAGDSFVVRFLQKNKVAFRLSRLDEKKGHVVTGVVVAGGKD